eukprot:gene3809-4391_t
MTDRDTLIKKQLLPLVAALNTNDEDVIDETCMNIRALFNQQANNQTQLLLEPELVQFVTQGLAHPSGEVKSCTLRLINSALLKAPKETMQWLQTNNLLQGVAASLVTPSLASAQAAAIVISSLSKIGKEAVGPLTSLATGLRAMYGQAADDSLRLRVLDSSVTAIAADPATLTAVYAPLLMLIPEGIESTDDELVRLNLFEIIENFASTPTGLTHVIDTLTGLLARSLTAESLSIERNFVLQLVGRLAMRGAGILTAELEPAVFAAITRGLEESGPAFDSAVATLGNLAVSEAGLDRVILQRTLIKSFGEELRSGDTRAIPTMHAYAVMLRGSGTDQTVRISDKLLQIYVAGGLENGVLGARLMKMLSSPIEEVKLAALGLIDGLARHSWGALACIQTPGFFEYLVSRTNEQSKVMREWKYTIIQVLVQHQQSILDTANTKEQWRQLTEYLKRGIHYIPSEANVQIATQEG